MAVDKATSKALTRRRARPPSAVLRLAGVAYGAVLLAVTVLPIRWSYFPPPVKLVEIPKPGGKEVRILGVATIADRVA